ASAGGQAPDSQNTNNSEAIAMGDTKNPKNVIFLIGDGMGPSFNTAYRYYADNPKTKEMDKTAFDNYLKGTMRVHND
ncbi:alkaline phosphatase, partial [Staphylococcus hominis]|uniref:alkaline phosphatase n=1 Tax=Staphylococcus hominis TaxID=1290 RepID=UPI0030BF20EB